MEASHAKREDEIREAALALFASKGYDGTSVDQIASLAHVNKATIYYYFSSKQAILDRLIEDFMQDMMKNLNEFLIQLPTSHILSGITLKSNIITLPDDGGGLTAFLEVYIPRMLDFFLERRDILRVMLMESLKEGENRFLPFRFTDIIAFNDPAVAETLTVAGMDIEPDQGLLVTKFFGGILPIVFYAVTGEAWVEHYETTRECLKEKLIELFRVMMAGYIKTHSTKEGETQA